MIGFAYGYASLPGQYYHELLARAFDREECDKWLRDCFEFVELAVHPSFRKQGLGRMLTLKLFARDVQACVPLQPELCVR